MAMSLDKECSLGGLKSGERIYHWLIGKVNKPEGVSPPHHFTTMFTANFLPTNLPIATLPQLLVAQRIGLRIMTNPVFWNYHLVLLVR